jgi:hypothetical protein
MNSAAKNYKGEARKLGIELEFHGLSPLNSAKVVAELLGGELNVKTVDDVEVTTKSGPYRFETDARFLKKLSEASAANIKDAVLDYQGSIREALSGISKEFVPTELVSPPLDIGNLSEINRIQKALVAAGAVGTSESVRFAFGAQLNPEIRTEDPNEILKNIKSFLILSVWLKSQIQMDLTRVLTSFAGDFPKDYIFHIFKKDGVESFDELIDDYLLFNPTRNRSLDMLPLFAFLDEKRVRAKVPSQKINKRPTYHYRLPNSQLSLDSWSIEVEWKRWMIIEKLVDADQVLFDQISTRFLDFIKGEISEKDWLIDSNNYVESLR